MNYNDITRIVNVNEYLNNLNVLCLVIYSETSLQKNEIDLSNNNFVLYSTKVITKEKKKIDDFFKNTKEYEKIISIGGGTATDIGKYLSYKFKKDLICIPTMLSTNAYSTNKVALKVNNKIETLDAVLPAEILLDINILQNSLEKNLYGMADIFSIHTALNDWRLASEFNKENITSEFKWAQQLLDLTVGYVISEKIDKIKNDAMMIYKLIGESGEITNKYGSGKPESASEHIFAKALEKEIKIPHAIAVANGILVMSIAQNFYMSDGFDIKIYKALEKLEIYKLNKKYNITYDLIDNVFLNLKPRKDRFSVVDLIYKDEDKKNSVLVEYKKIFENI